MGLRRAWMLVPGLAGLTLFMAGAAVAATLPPAPSIALADNHVSVEGRDLAPLAAMFRGEGSEAPIRGWSLWVLYRLDGRYLLHRVSRSSAGDSDGWADAASCPALDERAAALAALAPAQQPEGLRLVFDGPGFNLAFDPAFNPRPADKVLGRYGDPVEDWLALAANGLAGCLLPSPTLAKAGSPPRMAVVGGETLSPLASASFRGRPAPSRTPLSEQESTAEPGRVTIIGPGGTVVAAIEGAGLFDRALDVAEPSAPDLVEVSLDLFQAGQTHSVRRVTHYLGQPAVSVTDWADGATCPRLKTIVQNLRLMPALSAGLKV
ncbi:MAG: hypothetical protein JWM33_1866, partial [Caulobacteraceae bacterium]|nr:hypothetical protein [Caulobacteraceae bacterium]